MEQEVSKTNKDEDNLRKTERETYTEERERERAKEIARK